MLSVTMGKSTDVITVEAMDDRQLAAQDGNEKRKKEATAPRALVVHHKWSPHTTTNSTERQGTANS
jgi:hypothetical protein